MSSAACRSFVSSQCMLACRQSSANWLLLFEYQVSLRSGSWVCGCVVVCCAGCIALPQTTTPSIPLIMVLVVTWTFLCQYGRADQVSVQLAVPSVARRLHAGVIAATLTKLVLRLASLGLPRAAVNKASAASMLSIVSMMRLGESPALPTPLDDDSRDRMAACIKVLANPQPEMVKVRPDQPAGKGCSSEWCEQTGRYLW